jgi:hypothetical protein
MTDSPAINSATGEPQTKSGWSTDGGDDPAAGATALKPQSALAQPDQTDIGRHEAGIAASQRPYLEKLKSVLDSPQAAHAQLEKVKDEPNPQDYHKYSMEFASAAAVLGAVAGKFTRAGGTASLNAFSGALKGWQAGNLQAYEEASKQWEQDTKKTIQNNNIELEKYHEILNDKKANIEQMMAGLTIASSEYQNKVIFDMAKEGNFNAVAQAVDKMGVANQRLQGAYGKLTDLRSEQLAEAKGKIEYFQQHPEQLEGLPMKDYIALQGLSGAHPELGKLPPRPDGSTQVQSAVDMVGKNQANVSTVLSRMPQQYKQQFWDQLKAQYPEWTQQQFNANNAEATSEARITGGRIGRVNYAANLVDENIPAAARAAKAFPQGNFVPIDVVKLWAGRQDSSIPLSQWDVVNLQLLENYALLLNPGATTIRQDMFEKAAGPLSQAKSTAAYLATLQAIQDASQREREAGKETISQQHGQAPKARAPVSGAPNKGPQPGTIEDGFRFKGGNPADKSNWEPAT